ncbi:hypothetical protein Gohar_019341 [Gossypium harknessii]|uniref:Uncharacterized protein n=1 Tax=Gossypium harknessii TaxID=34285 RepID=A0A7J9GBW1_9ROSI|nr:hypothetical protein [Gossypium harknessii]
MVFSSLLHLPTMHVPLIHLTILRCRRKIFRQPLRG